MKRRSSTYAKACGVLGLEPSTPFEEIARCYRTLAEELHPNKHPDDPAAAARMVEVNGAWARIKYEAGKRRTRLVSTPLEPEQTLTVCAWPHPPTTRSAAFAGCELRPTENARCYRVLKDGRLLLILDRHPDDERLLFARNERGRIVAVNGVSWWTDAGGEVRPVG
jgi:hypothetical protein